MTPLPFDHSRRAGATPDNPADPATSTSEDDALLAEAFAIAELPDGIDNEADAEAAAAAEAEHAARQEALTALISSGLIAGPDPSVVGQIKSEDEVDFSLGDEPSPDFDELDDWQAADDALAAAGFLNESDQALEDELVRIYADILARAPEHKVQPSISRVERALELLGRPHDSYPIIHIGGTNGKTSIARMTETLIGEHGLSTGRFTSPHLHTVRERIALGGQPISTADFVSTYRQVLPILEQVDRESADAGGPRMSFFEVFTVMAYLAFANAAVDVAIIEVGMGGRWDATNAADGQIAILTPISIDHQRWLGDTLEEIAGEKVGIIKDGATVITSFQHDDVATLIEHTCAERDATLLAEGEQLAVLESEFAVGGQIISLQTPAGTYEEIMVPLFGQHQGHNALLALAATEVFFGGRMIDARVVEKAFLSVTSPGRLEIIRRSPLIITDAGHNPGGVASALTGYREAFSPERTVVVFGAMADKDIAGMLELIEEVADVVVLTTMGSERAANAEDIASIARPIFGPDRVVIAHQLEEAIDRAVRLAEVDPEAVATSQVVLVIGSVQLAAHAREVVGKADRERA